MSPERWQKIEDVFQAVVDLAPDARLSYLNENHADDRDLVAEIQRLIADYEEAGDFIESPVWTDSFMLGATAREEIGDALGEEIKKDNHSMIGKRLGVYLLTKELGRGGMGAVYLAERADGEFRQRVALKVIKRGMDTDFIVRRFRNERQILASLDHPNIARLLDGGTTDDGLPFFVMEYIEGSPVYRYSDARKLSINERLRLFSRICGAVDYAHENLIIHRDIKPNNILITSEGIPKLLDFGIAKILNPELAADSIDPTATAMRMMTPEYASPEQVRGEAVTKASDIYSLGVLLYELLTGHRPYRLKNRALHEIARVICEEEPENLGSSLTREDNLVPTYGSDSSTVEFIFESRSASREALRRELSGDLERVVFKALRKNPNERYESAAELAKDILRYLEGQPVLATDSYPSKPVSAPGVHRTNADEISVAVLPFKLFGAATNEDTGDDYLCIGLADALITRLSNVRRFIIRPTSSVLKYGNNDTEPIAAGEELGVSYVIDGNIRRVGNKLRVTVQLLNISESAARWAEKFDAEFTDVLSLEDSISEKIAEALLPQLTGDERDKLKKRGTNNPEALEHYLRGRHHWNSFTEDGFAKAIIAYYQAIAHDPNYALAYAGIADYHNWLGVYGVLPSKECFQSAIENSRQAIALDAELGEAYASLAFARHGGNFEWEESERDFQTALRLNPNVAETHVWYSIKLTTEGRFTEGIKHAERAVELDSQTPFNQHNLGWILYYARQFDKSLRQYKKTAGMFPVYPLAHYGLAWVLRYLGRFDEAIAAASRAQELMSESVFSLHVQGQTFAAAGMREQTEVILEKLAGLSRKQYVSPYHTAMIYAFLDEREKALELLESCLHTSEAWLVWLGVEPAFDSLRAEPRFKAVMAQTKNPILQRTTENKREKSNPTLAVLPFKVMTTAGDQNTDDKFLGVGLADSLITRLSNIRRFTVRPTSSVLQFDTSSDPFGAGERLKVDFLIDGNIRRIGQTLRVTVQLLSIEDGATRWARRFDEKITDFLTLEDVISEQIVSEILPQLTGEEEKQLKKRGTNDNKAHEAYLRGRYFWNKFTNESFPKAFESFSEAVRLDPDFALAHVGIADYYIWLCIFGVLPSLEAFPKAKESARRALEIDPNLGEAYTTLAFATTIHDWDWEKAEKLFKRALELSPNYPFAHEWYSNLLAPVGRFDEAVRESRRAVELNPLSARGLVMHGWLLYQTRRYAETLTEVKKAVEMEKDFPQGLLHLGNALDQIGRSEEAVTALRESIRLWQDSALPRNMLCHALVNCGRENEAREVLGEILAENEKHHVKPYFIAVAYAAFAGERDAVFEWLEKAFAERNEWLIWLGTEPKFDALRDDPRFVEMLERMNNPIVSRLDDAAEAEEIHQSQIATKIFPVAETTGEIAEEPATEENMSATKRKKTWMYAAAAVILLPILAVFSYNGIQKTESGYELTFGANAAKPPIAVLPNHQTIAVLPFETDADYENEESFGIGLAESVGEKLRQVKELSVRLAFLKFKTNPSIEDLAKNYAVNYVVRGKLHVDGERVKVNAELVSTTDGKVLWLENFDEKLSDLQNLQTSISERVLKALTIELSANERQQISKNFTQNSEAYQLYLVGRYQLSNRSAANLNKAIKTFEKTRNLDPKFALAYAGLADSYALLNLYQIPPPPDAYQKAKENALKAIELDPNLAEAHASLGYVLFYYEHRRDEAVRELGRAIELNPSYSTAYHWLALALSAMGKHEEAIRDVKAAIELEPRSAIIQTAAGLVYFYARKYDDALATAEKVLENNEGFVPAYKTKRVVYEASGNYSAALSAYQNERIYSENTDENDEGWMMIAAQVQAVGGSRDEALASLKRTTENSFVKNNPNAFAYEIALAYALLGENDPAIEWLKKSKEVNSYGFNFATVDPRFDKIKDDPRFREIIRISE
jgi:TolB-like protein/Tfp pilus assembly protein PilF/tRNA A-37 threonylcarbamoyl transferase component Bud32